LQALSVDEEGKFNHPGKISPLWYHHIEDIEKGSTKLPTLSLLCPSRLHTRLYSAFSDSLLRKGKLDVIW